MNAVRWLKMRRDKGLVPWASMKGSRGDWNSAVNSELRDLDAASTYGLLKQGIGAGVDIHQLRDVKGTLQEAGAILSDPSSFLFDLGAEVSEVLFSGGCGSHYFGGAVPFLQYSVFIWLWRSHRYIHRAILGVSEVN